MEKMSSIEYRKSSGQYDAMIKLTRKVFITLEKRIITSARLNEIINVNGFHLLADYKEGLSLKPDSSWAVFAERPKANGIFLPDTPLSHLSSRRLDLYTDN